MAEKKRRWITEYILKLIQPSLCGSYKQIVLTENALDTRQSVDSQVQKGELIALNELKAAAARYKLQYFFEKKLSTRTPWTE